VAQYGKQVERVKGFRQSDVFTLILLKSFPACVDVFVAPFVVIFVRRPIDAALIERGAYHGRLMPAQQCMTYLEVVAGSALMRSEESAFWPWSAMVC
jgi:hypothetical protein